MGHYNKKNLGSLAHQVKTNLDSMLAIGESKHVAKIAGNSYRYIYSWNTYRTYLKHACYFVTWCKDQYGCKTLDDCKSYAAAWIATRSHQWEAWTDSEASYALSVCTDPILKLCMYLALGCSMRIGEILGLTWDCIHIEPELVQNDEAYLCVEKELRRSSKNSIAALRKQGRNDVFFTFPEWKKTNCTTSLVLKTPKTESSVRNIYIPKSVVLALEENHKQQEQMKADLANEYQDYNIVVAQNNGRPYEEHQIAQKLKALITEHNLKSVVFHSLRHSSTSLKLRISGGDIKAVQGDTGHAQSNMVTDVYSHIMNDDRKRLARNMEQQFFSPSVSPENEKAAAHPPVNESTEKLMQLLNHSPELADHLLQMSQLLSTK